jgi:hypothetical protein
MYKYILSRGDFMAREKDTYLNYLLIVLVFLYALLPLKEKYSLLINLIFLGFFLSSPFLIRMLRKKVVDKTIQIYLTSSLVFLEPFCFLFWLILLLNFVLIELVNQHIMSDSVAIYLLFVLILGYILPSILRILFFVVEKLNIFNNENKFNKVLNIWILTGTCIFALVIADVVYTKMVYEFYLAAINKPFSFWSVYYFSFSLHFLTPFSGSGEEIKGILTTNAFGQILMVVHMILVRVIDITVIGTISGLFIQWLKKRGD